MNCIFSLTLPFIQLPNKFWPTFNNLPIKIRSRRYKCHGFSIPKHFIDNLCVCVCIVLIIWWESRLFCVYSLEIAVELISLRYFASIDRSIQIKLRQWKDHDSVWLAPNFIESLNLVRYNTVNGSRQQNKEWKIP